MGELAGEWVRVSTGGQDEASQVPDIERHCDQHGYTIAKRYELHDRSASKGEQQDKLNEVIADMASGAITVLVCWHSDRLDRRGPKAGYAFLWSAELVGGRIESVLDPDFGKEDVGSEVLTTIRMAGARDESKLKSERVRISFDQIDASGSIRSKPIYGYRIVGKKFSKTFEVIESEAEVIREAASRYVGGESLAQICRSFNDAGKLTRTGSKWSPKTLGQILRSETIMGRHPQGSKTVRVPEILTVREWRAVQAKLDAKAYRKGVRTRNDTALLTSILYCGHCGRPMYRIMGGYGKSRGYYYYCRSGKNGCRMMLPLADTDRQFIEWVATDQTIKVTRTRVIPGHNYQDDIDRIALDIQALDPLADGWLAKVTEMRAEIDRLASLPSEPDRTETTEVGLADLLPDWSNATDAERRAALLSVETHVYAIKRDGEVTLAILPVHPVVQDAR